MWRHESMKWTKYKAAAIRFLILIECERNELIWDFTLLKHAMKELNNPSFTFALNTWIYKALRLISPAQVLEKIYHHAADIFYLKKVLSSGRREVFFWRPISATNGVRNLGCRIWAGCGWEIEGSSFQVTLPSVLRRRAIIVSKAFS